MIPVNLKLSNFTSYGESPPELNFTSFKLAAISGLNGAGKSSLLDALTWCLWGTSRAGDSSDELVHSGANDMQVEFAFELDDSIFTVKRRRSKKHGGSTVLEFWAGKNNLTEGTIKATQEKIINLLHLSFETFTNSSYLRQGHADEFTTKGPTDRKRILADILGLNHFDKLEERAKEKIKEADAKLKLLEYQLLEIEAELSQKGERQKILTEQAKKVHQVENTIKLLEEETKILQKEKEALVIILKQRQNLSENLESQQKELADIISQGKERAERIKNLEFRIKNYEVIEKEITKLKTVVIELESLRKKQQEKLQLQKELADLQGQLNLKTLQQQTLIKELEKIQDEIKKLSQPWAKCPTCGQEIGKDQKHDVGSKFKAQKSKLKQQISQIQTKEEEDEIKNLNQKLSATVIDDQKFQQLEKSAAELESLQKQKETFLKDQATLETERKTREELLILYQNKKNLVEKLAKELEKLPQVEDDLVRAENNLGQKEEQLQSFRSEEKQARSLLGQATELLSRTKQLEKLLEEKRRDQTDSQRERQVFEELSLAFGKKGIQAMIIEAAIPEIETEANRLLDKLTEGRMKIMLETQRETKTLRLHSGQANGEKVPGIIETLDILISDEMGERPYELYSGGETFRVNFAIRLAISKLLTHRAGAKLQFLVIDEGFGTQDAPGRARLVEVLDAIKDDFEKILVITHIEELKEEFPVRIEVSKNSDGSTFELVGV